MTIPVISFGVQGPPGIVVTSTTTTALLALITDAGFPDGSQAFVTGVGYYGLARTSTATIDGYQVVATASGNGRWILQLPIAAKNPAFTVTNWYWDPSNVGGLASDSNTGTSISAPLLTFAGFISKMGTDRPTLPYGQSLTINQLSGQPSATTDPVFFEPKLSGGGVFGWLGTAGLSLVSTQTPTALTAMVRGGPGTLLSVTLASVTGIAVGQLVIDNTRGSNATVHAIVGNVVTLTQPVTQITLAGATRVLVPVEDTGWAATDSLSFYTQPALNLKSLRPQGGDNNSGNTGGFTYFQHVCVVNSSGASVPAASTLHLASDNKIFFVDCQVLSYLVVAPGAEYRTSEKWLTTLMVNCYGPQGFAAHETGFFAGEWGTSGVNTMQRMCVLEGDIIIGATQNALAAGSGGHIGNCYNATAISMFHGGVIFQNSIFGGDQIVWGPGTVSVQGMWQMLNGLTYTAKLLVSGALTIDGQTTASSYVAGVWTDGITVNPTNLDSNTGLQRPRTGSRMCIGS